MIILKIILYLLLFLLLLLAAALAAPVKYLAEGQKYESSFIRLETTWLFRALNFILLKEDDRKMALSIKIFGFSIVSRKSHKEEKEKVKRKKKKKAHGGHLGRDYINQVIGLVKAMLDHIKPRVIFAEGTYGFEDPFYTAMSCIIVNNLSSWAEGFSIKLKPVFDEEVLEGRFLVQGRAVPAVILWQLAIFRLSRPVRERNKYKKERKRKVYAN
jgi:hypothetical protein